MSTQTNADLKARLAGKVAVVTGATSGIGADSVRVFAQHGLKVVFAGRRKDKGQALQTELQSAGLDVRFKQTDVAKAEELKALFEYAQATYGGVDLVFNNAGIEGTVGPISDPKTLASFDDVFNINVKAVAHSFEHAVPLLNARKGGVIISTSSVTSVLPVPTFSVYAASKAALDHLSRAAAAELASQNIQVYTINPYVFVSEMSARAGESFPGGADSMAKSLNPSNKAGTGSEIGEFVLELLAGQHSSQYSSGANIAIDAGKAHFPVAEVPAKAQAKAAAAAASQ
eukprot:m.74893 g.74893  ORF g.74893 m.74893 type:complete len:286 (-) comp17132_c0_seq2:133-990(-)